MAPVVLIPQESLVEGVVVEYTVKKVAVLAVAELMAVVEVVVLVVVDLGAVEEVALVEVM